MAELQKTQKQLESEHKQMPSTSTLKQLTMIRNEINKLNTQAIKRKLLYLKQKYYECG